MEGSVENDVRQSIKLIIDGHPDVKSWHQLRTRKVGRELFLDVHILVKPDLSVDMGHRIAEEVEAAVKKAFTRPVNVLTHVEPDFPLERRKVDSDIRIPLDNELRLSLPLRWQKFKL